MHKSIKGWFYEDQLKYKRFDAPPLPPVSNVNGTTLAVEPSAETVAWMQEKWEALVTPKTGLKDYAEMLAAWQKEQWDLKMEKEHINTLLGASHS